MGAAVIGVLTTAAAVATGGIGAGIVGALLKTGNELLKGESLSKSLASGAGAGAVGALAGWGVKEIAQWMPGMSFDMSKVPGYTDLVHVKHLHQTNGITTFSLDTDMTYDAARKVNKLLAVARDADYDKAAKIYADIENIFRNPEYLKTVQQVAGTNTDLYNNAVATAKKAADFWGGVADAAQGGATAAASADQKTTTTESIDLSEADIKGIASSIANWAKTQASQVTQQITPEKLGKAWRDAGSPDDSNALHGILLKAGVPADVLTAAYGAQKIPVPRGQSQTKDAIRKRQARANAKAAADSLPVNTGDPADDAKVKQIYAQQGKAAAITYLQSLLAKAQDADKAKAAGNLPAAAQGMKLQASDGKTYELSIGKAGDRIWLDANTRGEAPENIDTELGQKIAPALAAKPAAAKDHSDSAYAKTAAQKRPGSSKVSAQEGLPR
jgi:plasmid stabilization system protein ParE